MEKWLNQEGSVLACIAGLFECFFRLCFIVRDTAARKLSQGTSNEKMMGEGARERVLSAFFLSRPLLYVFWFDLIIYITQTKNTKKPPSVQASLPISLNCKDACP